MISDLNAGSVKIEDEMKKSYLEYSMSVIVAVSYTHLTLPTN